MPGAGSVSAGEGGRLSAAVDKTLGRFRARPVKAPAHSPRFEQSAMYGFAVRLNDVRRAGPGRPVTLDLADELVIAPAEEASLTVVPADGGLPVAADDDR